MSIVVIDPHATQEHSTIMLCSSMETQQKNIYLHYNVHVICVH